MLVQLPGRWRRWGGRAGLQAGDGDRRAMRLCGAGVGNGDGVLRVLAGVLGLVRAMGKSRVRIEDGHIAAAEPRDFPCEYGILRRSFFRDSARYWFLARVPTGRTGVAVRAAPIPSSGGGLSGV